MKGKMGQMQKYFHVLHYSNIHVERWRKKQNLSAMKAEHQW
jgi:hypothetical protein